MEYYLLDALHHHDDKFEQIHPSDLKAKYGRGKFLFQLALQNYHDAFHTFLQKAFMCYEIAYRILLDNLDKKAQDRSSTTSAVSSSSFENVLSSWSCPQKSPKCNVYVSHRPSSSAIVWLFVPVSGVSSCGNGNEFNP